MTPLDIFKLGRTYEELEHFWLYCICAAGKNADVAAAKVNQLLRQKPEHETSIFAWLTKPDINIDLENMLKVHKIGQYTRITKAIRESAEIDLQRATVADLEQIHGVGPKTCRLFLLYSRPNVRLAVLDVHILKWLRMHNVNVPEQNTPQNRKRYQELQSATLSLMDRYFPKMSYAQADLLIWAFVSGRFDALPFIEMRTL